MSPKALISIAKKSDAEAIVHYYNQLSEATKQKFAPHPFTTAYLEEQILESKEYIALIAKDSATNKVIDNSNPKTTVPPKVDAVKIPKPKNKISAICVILTPVSLMVSETTFETE